jgi:flagellin-like hook-associated protein FlgL
MSTAINTIQAANNGITSITKLVQSAQALASQAKQTSDADTRSSLAAQFDALLTQIDQLAGDSGFNGINLLGKKDSSDTDNDLVVTMNETGGSSITISAVDFTTDANGLNIGGANANWATLDDVKLATDDLTGRRPRRSAPTCRPCRFARTSPRR